MTIDQKTVAKIAKLSKLNIPEDEQAGVANDLNKLLDWVAQLNEVNVEGIAPLTGGNDLPLRWRDDVISDGGKTDDVLANAPSRTADFFTVPKVIE
jgi:aspartyl-tRNA(Asn)/glutamyl-tRNA(Gln) amidotransferase subunit C